MRMRLDELLATYRPAFSDSWDEAFESMLTSPAEGHRIGVLRQLVRAGSISQAVELDSCERIVSDGMHRILAHHLEGACEIEVAIDAEWVMPYPDIIDVAFTCAEPDSDEVINALLSFAIGDAWAQSDVASHQNQTYRFHYSWPQGQIEELRQGLVRQASLFGMQLIDLTVEVDHDIDED